MPELQLRRWFWVLVGAVTAGIVQVLFLQPQLQASLGGAIPTDFPGAQWMQGGEEGSGLHSRNRGLSPTRTFRPVPAARNAGEEGVRLQLTAVAMRRPKDFMVAALTKGIPAQSLRNRNVRNTVQGEVASGLIQGRPALQACLMPGGATAVTRTKMLALHPDPDRNLRERAASLLGFRAKPPYRCLLVTLVATDPAMGPDRLRHLWDRLSLPALSTDSQAEQTL